MKKDKNGFYTTLKRLLYGYRRMTSGLRRHLTKLGFTIITGRKHLKIYWGTNWSRCCVVSKTASDCKSGKNIAAELYRMANLS